MSIHLKIEELSSQQISQIKKDLLFTPRKFTHGSFKDESTEPILFCDINEETGYISLPFYYARHILGIKKNIVRKFIGEPLQTDKNPLSHQGKIIGDALDCLNQYNTVTLRTFPGSGKTIMCAWISSAYSGIPIIINHLSIQPPQWKKAFLFLFPKLDGKIWIVGEKDPPAMSDIRVVICMIGRVDKVPQEIRDNIGIVIYDEAHLLATREKVHGLLSFEAPYNITVTATLERDDRMEDMFYAISGIHSIKLINQSPYMVFRFNTGIKFDLDINRQGTVDYTSLVRKQSECEERNEKMIKIISNNLHRKYIVLTRHKNHASRLAELCKESGISCDTLYGNKNKYEDSTVLVGTIPKIGTAFDEENGCRSFNGRKSDTLILMSSIKCDFNKKEVEQRDNFSSVRTLEQNRGRIMRAHNPCIIYFVDEDKISQKHFHGGKRWFEYTNGRINEVYNEETLKLPEVGSLEWEE
jgi:superfamily II DNA or RNA helicase